MISRLIGPSRSEGSPCPRRGAFTLLELLVVLAILALLVALTLAAIQRARGAAARMACQNNLRQLALGVHGYADAHQQFPAGCDKRPGSLPQGGGRVPVSWLTVILPFVEQEALWRDVLEAFRNDPSGESSEHARIQAVPIALFRCPSDSRTIGWEFPNEPWGLTSYLGVAGTDVPYDDGLFHRDVNYRFSDVTDGTSNTLMLGERPAGPLGRRGGWYGRWGGTAFDQIRGAAYAGRPPTYAVNCRAPLNEFRAGSIDDPCDVVHYWSLHPGGGNFAFADGSVRFIPYSAAGILPELATRAGGEVVSLD
jgi:prepilin-type N-terminal cleavage/methylation domain-containing protein/prepilin-type processing-associated H-X9-DG protein